jgi:hypothetical protein
MSTTSTAAYAKLVLIVTGLARGQHLWATSLYPDQLAADLEEVYRQAGAPLRCGYAAEKRTDPDDDYSPVTDAMHCGGEFGEPEERRFPWSRTYTAEHWLSQLRTHSDHAALPAYARDRLFGDIEDAIDRFGGSFTMRYTTALFSAIRR